MSKISVIMPSLNVSKYIRECIESVIGQTFDDIEILCVDAGSTDGTLEILKEYEIKDERVHIINSEKRSYGYQVNLGIKKAKGKYISIVETDDYIVNNMYEILYPLAEKNEVDIIKANWDNFHDTENERVFEIRKMPGSNTGVYDRVINIDDEPHLYSWDIMVWRGLYNKKFLIDNNIWFNESAGAAYQDYGFSVLALTHAEKLYYISDSLYRYRFGRQDASSWNRNILKYVYQEWNRLLTENLIPVKYKNDSYLYRRMAEAFIGECERLLVMEDYNIKSEYISEYYKWFRPIASEMIKNNVVYSYGWEELYKKLNMLVYSLQGFADCVYVEELIKRQQYNELKEFSKDKDVFIFGAGLYGQTTYAHCKDEGIDVIGYIDNNDKQWGTNIGQKKVFAPHQCVSEYLEAGYIVANKLYAEEIKNQLVNMGVDKEKIIIFIPEVL